MSGYAGRLPLHGPGDSLLFGADFVFAVAFLLFFHYFLVGNRTNMQKSNRFYKTGFFLFLSLLLLLIAAVVPALIKGVSPRQWYGTLLSSEDEDRSKARVIPTSSFTDLELVDSIQPAEQTREALAASANRVVIFFSEPMKTDYDDILANYSVYTKDKPLEFRNYSWRDEKTFVLTFDRSLEEGESVLLDFRFVPADNNQDQLIRIAYE